MSKHPYIGHLSVGDTIQTESGGKKISLTIKDISIDPTWGDDGGLLIYLDHTVDNITKETCVGLRNFIAWFEGVTWEKVKK